MVSSRHPHCLAVTFGLIPMLAVALLWAVCLGPAVAAAAEPLLPNVVADSPDNVTLETSTTEGGLNGSSEAKLLLRFNGYIHNIGPGALDFRGSRKSASEPMKAFQRIYNSDGTFKEEPSSAQLIYVTADGHQHWHLQRAARYSLWNSSKSAEVAPAMKVGFCLDDSEHVEPAVGPNTAVYSDATGREFCRQHQPEATSLFEGVSTGWRDLYKSNLAFQWVDASEVLPGEYWLREDVNTTGVIKEVAGTNAPSYATKATVVPGFDALPENVTARAEEANAVTLTANAWSDAATPKYTIVSQPQHGRLSAVGANQVTYTPNAGYTGSDSFTYSAADPSSPFPRHPDVATVSLEVAAGTGGGGGEAALLAGDSSAAYGVGDQTSVGREEAFQFTAKASGTVEEMQFRTNATANTGVTGVVLGVFAENAGKPGAVLGQVTVAGEPPVSSWVKATGFSVAVVSAAKYWLVVLPQGTVGKRLHFNAAAVSGGTGNLESVAGGLGSLTAESSWETFNQGPLGFQAIGKTSTSASVIRAAAARATIARLAAQRTSQRARPARHHPVLALAGAPSSMRVATSVQLSVLLAHGHGGLRWSASAGTISAAGLYSAPTVPPRGGSVTLRATARGGAHDSRRIAILALEGPRPAPAAPAAPSGEGAAPSGLLPMPRAMLVGHTLVITGSSALPGNLVLSAELAGRRLGRCSVSTPAGRDVTCIVALRGVSTGAPIELSATLHSGTQTLSAARPPLPVAPMEMPTATPLHHDYRTAAASFLCTPPPVPAVADRSARWMRGPHRA